MSVELIESLRRGEVLAGLELELESNNERSLTSVGHVNAGKSGSTLTACSAAALAFAEWLLDADFVLGRFGTIAKRPTGIS